MFVVFAVAKVNEHHRASERNTGSLKSHMKDGQSRQTAKAGDEGSSRNHQSTSKKRRDPKPEVKEAHKRLGKRLEKDIQKGKGNAATNGDSNSKHKVEQKQRALAEVRRQEKEMEDVQLSDPSPKESKKRKRKRDSEGDEEHDKGKKTEAADDAGAEEKTRKKRKVKDGDSEKELQPKVHPLPSAQAPLRSTPTSKPPPGPQPPNGIAKPSWSFSTIQEANTIPQPELDQDQDSVILPTTEAPSPDLGPATSKSMGKMANSDLLMNGIDDAKATLYQISQLLMASDPADFGEEDEAIGRSPPWHPLDDIDMDGTEERQEEQRRVQSKKAGKRIRSDSAAPDGKANGMLSDADDHEELAHIENKDEAGQPSEASDEEDSTSHSISTSSSNASTPEAEAEKHPSHPVKKNVSQVGKKSLTSSANVKATTSADIKAGTGAAANTGANSDSETITVRPAKVKDTQDGLPNSKSTKKSIKTQSTTPNDGGGDHPTGALNIKEKKASTKAKSQSTAEKQPVKEASSRQRASKSANSMDQEPSKSGASITFGRDWKPQTATGGKQAKDTKDKKGKDKVTGGDEKQPEQKKQKRSKEPHPQSREVTPSSRTSSPEPSPSPKKSRGRRGGDGGREEDQGQQKVRTSKKPPAPSKEKTRTSTSTITQPPSNQNDIKNKKANDVGEQEEKPDHNKQQKSLESRFDSRPDAPPSKAKKSRGSKDATAIGNEKKPGQTKQQQPKNSRLPSNEKSLPSQATSTRPSSSRSNSKNAKSSEFITASDDSDAHGNSSEANHSDEDDARPPPKSKATATTKQSSVRPNRQHEGRQTDSPKQLDDNNDKQSYQSPPPTQTKRKYVRRNPVPDTVRGPGETASSEPPHKGPFQKPEKAALDEFKINYCTMHSLSTSEFLSLVHSNARSNYADRAVFWNDVSESTPRRDRASVQKFCRKYWPPENVKRGDFTAEEDEQIKKLVAEKGTLWKSIAKIMDRLGDDVKDRYQNHINTDGTAGAVTSKKNKKENENENEDDDKGEEESDDE